MERSAVGQGGFIPDGRRGKYKWAMDQIEILMEMASSNKLPITSCSAYSEKCKTLHMVVRVCTTVNRGLVKNRFQSLYLFFRSLFASIFPLLSGTTVAEYLLHL